MHQIPFYNLAYQRDAEKEKPSISRIFFIKLAIFGISPVQDAVIIKNVNSVFSCSIFEIQICSSISKSQKRGELKIFNFPAQFKKIKYDCSQTQRQFLLIFNLKLPYGSSFRALKRWLDLKNISIFKGSKRGMDFFLLNFINFNS